METVRTSSAFSICVKNWFAVYDDKIENEVTNGRIKIGERRFWEGESAYITIEWNAAIHDLIIRINGVILNHIPFKMS